MGAHPAKAVDALARLFQQRGRHVTRHVMGFMRAVSCRQSMMLTCYTMRLSHVIWLLLWMQTLVFC